MADYRISFNGGYIFLYAQHPHDPHSFSVRNGPYNFSDDFEEDRGTVAYKMLYLGSTACLDVMSLRPTNYIRDYDWEIKNLNIEGTYNFNERPTVNFFLGTAENLAKVSLQIPFQGKKKTRQDLAQIHSMTQMSSDLINPLELGHGKTMPTPITCDYHSSLCNIYTLRDDFYKILKDQGSEFVFSTMRQRLKEYVNYDL
jgi:hypothetical protein